MVGRGSAFGGSIRGSRSAGRVNRAIKSAPTLTEPQCGAADFAHGVPPDAEGEGGKMKPAGGETHRGLPRLGSWTSLCMGATSVAGNAVNAIVPKLIPEESPAAVVSRAGLWSRRTAQWGLHCGNRCGSSRPTQRLASGSRSGKK